MRLPTCPVTFLITARKPSVFQPCVLHLKAVCLVSPLSWTDGQPGNFGVCKDFSFGEWFFGRSMGMQYYGSWQKDTFDSMFHKESISNNCTFRSPLLFLSLYPVSTHISDSWTMSIDGSVSIVFQTLSLLLTFLSCLS